MLVRAVAGGGYGYMDGCGSCDIRAAGTVAISWFALKILW